MIFELLNDLAAVLDAMPAEQSHRQILALLEEAIRRDIHFIDRHPTTLFQCLWNSCQWHDQPHVGRGGVPPGECFTGTKTFAGLTGRWQRSRADTGDRLWLRALTPPPVPLSGRRDNALTFSGPLEGISTICMDEGRGHLFAADRAGRIGCWDFWTGKTLDLDPPAAVQKFGCASDPESLALSPDGTLAIRLLSPHWRSEIDGDMWYCPLEVHADGKKVPLPELVRNGISCLTFSPRGEWLLLGHDASVTAVGLGYLRQRLRENQTERNGVTGTQLKHLGFSPDARYLLYSDKSDQVTILSLASGACQSLGWYHGFAGAHFSADGCRLKLVAIPKLREELAFFQLEGNAWVPVASGHEITWIRFDCSKENASWRLEVGAEVSLCAAGTGSVCAWWPRGEGGIFSRADHSVLALLDGHSVFPLRIECPPADGDPGSGPHTDPCPKPQKSGHSRRSWLTQAFRYLVRCMAFWR